MANDLETMRERLAEQLSDAQHKTWSAGEKDDILKWAVRRLNQRLPRPIDPIADMDHYITLTSGDEFYPIPSEITHVWRVDLYDSDDNTIGPLESGWEVVGDLLTGAAQLHVSLQIPRGYNVMLVGAGRYELPNVGSTTNAIPDDYVALVLAMARAEAYSRLLSDRARFRQWLNAGQEQNVSVNELIQMKNDAELSAEREWALFRRWQKPVPARV